MQNEQNTVFVNIGNLIYEPDLAIGRSINLDIVERKYEEGFWLKGG